MSILVETVSDWVDAILPTLPGHTEVTSTTADVDYFLTENADH